MSTNQEHESNKMLKVLDFCYEKAINGIPKFDSAVEMAEDYLSKNNGSVEDAIKSLVRYQNAKAITAGFLTGLGGLITLPVALPANMVSVLYVQIRMIAAIAHLKGYDLKSDQVKTLVFVAVTGNSAMEILKSSGIIIVQKMMTNYIKNKLSSEIIKIINKKVGFRLISKEGTKAPIVLTKAVPVIGGIVGGASDGISTNIIANTAKKIFV
ncbi:EcsC family protein [Paenibacillus sp. LjRoot56]|uniref:EcsC family protein n=1 Tax=Paenibacillus sp. LjRoot56 TaxID=3342333 RepID=UPI003ECFA77D